MGELKKELGLIDVWVISTGAILSSGIFILPGFAFAKSGAASILAYIVAAILMSGALALKIKILVKAASCILILTYIFTCIAVIILRESKLQNYKPDFKTPLYPWIQTSGIKRDSIIKDDFYELAENAKIIDIEEEINLETFFTMVADKMGSSLDIKPGKLYNLLLERESESSTIISPDVAIPHIVMDGEDNFHLLLARSRKGIRFDNDDSRIKAVFMLFGTRNKRNLHLKSLAAIAQIIKNSDFIEGWLAAKNEEALRDIVLLSERNQSERKKQ